MVTHSYCSRWPCALPHGHRPTKWWYQWASSPLPEAILNGWMPLQSTAG